MYLSTDKSTISIKWLQLDSIQPLLRKRTLKHLVKLAILAIWLSYFANWVVLGLNPVVVTKI